MSRENTAPVNVSMPPRCYVEIDASAFEHNLAQIKKRAPNTKIMAVIKADAYGHGMEIAAKQLDSADEFAVSGVEEMLRLHDAGFTKPLTLLSASFDADQLQYFAQHNVRPVIFDYEQLQMLRNMPADTGLECWLKVDTGMGRLGFLADEFLSVLDTLKGTPGVRSVSLMTHLADADKPHYPSNTHQFTLFKGLLKNAIEHEHRFKDISVLNSAGIVAFCEQAYDVLRPGIMLYGISPSQSVSAHKLGLRPVMQFKSTVISVRCLPAGSKIGYGGIYTLDSDSRIAYVACGYGDGYPRHAKSGTNVCVNGFLVPLVGRVSMDIIAVDITELPVQIGDSVTLWGNEIPIEDVAESADTIAYELSCGITQRVTRKLI